MASPHDAVEEDDGNEYYTLLNVDRKASSEEIRSAYHRLCRIYHPDRYHDPEKQLSAGNLFRRIQEAYNVLSDPRTRAVYDRSGRKGLETDMALIERSTLPTELLEEYDKLKRLWEERTFIQEANPQGSFSMELDATSLMDGRTPRAGKLSVEKLSLSQSVDAQLTKSAFSSVAGMVTAAQHSLFGGLQLSLRHLLSNQNWVKVSMLLGGRPAVGVELYHTLSSDMYITSNSLCTLSPYGAMLSANAAVTRRLNPSTSATLSLKETGNAVSAQLVHRLSSSVDLVTAAQVGYSNSFVKAVVNYRPGTTYLLKAGVKLGTNGASAYYGAEQEVGSLTRIGGTVVCGTEDGVAVKLRLVRATMAFQVRLQVSHYLSLPAVFYATTVPLLLYGCFKVFAVAPLLHHQRLKKLKERKVERAREVVERRKEAEAAVELMQETVERIRTTEQAKHGLLIVEAWYGQLFDTQGADDGLLQSRVVDVCVPLQCLVVDSKLILHESSKANLPGFYDPCVGETKFLRVRYEFRGTPHEVTIKNSEPLIIPRRSHRIVSLVD